MPTIKRKRLLLGDLHTDYFKKKTVAGDCKIVPRPAYQVVAAGIDPNATMLEPKDGSFVIESNGSNIVKIWIWDDVVSSPAKWISD